MAPSLVKTKKEVREMNSMKAKVVEDSPKKMRTVTSSLRLVLSIVLKSVKRLRTRSKNH